MPLLETAIRGRNGHTREIAAGAAPALACGAKTRKGTPCQQPAMANGRCRMHGGTNLYPGPSSPAYRTGRYSPWLKNLPRELAESAQESIAQGAEIAQDDSIATLDALLAETASQMDRGAADGLWKALGEHAAEAQKLKAKADQLRDQAASGALHGEALEKAQEAIQDYEIALDSVFILISEGVDYAGHRQELVRLLEQRRKHADTEIKRRTAAFASMQSSQVLQMFTVMLQLAMELIPSKVDRARLLREMKAKLPGMDVLFGGG